MDELNPKSQLSYTARAGGWLAATAIVCVVLAETIPGPVLGYVGAACLALGLMLGTFGFLDIRRSEGRLRGLGWAKFSFWATLSVIVYAFFAPVAHRCGSRMRFAAAQNDFKLIALALDHYRDSCGRFPPAFVSDASGRPLYSWRVLILPYLEETQLYARFHLDESWDSPHNRALLPLMPPTYRLPHRSHAEQPEGTTFVQVFLGKGTAFESPRGEPLILPDGTPNFPDGLAETLLAVEARTAMPWTQPTFLPFLADAPLPTLGGTDPPGWWSDPTGDNFLATTANTRALSCSRKIEERTLRALITRNGGEPIDSEKY